MENGERLMDDQVELEAIDVLKKAFKILAKNTNFIILTILTSLPFWSFLVYYETTLQDFITQTSDILEQRPEYTFWEWPIPFDIVDLLDKNFWYELIKLCFLYLVPLHLLELITVIVIVDFSSKIYTKDTQSLTLKNMVQQPFCGAKLKGSLVTLIYVVFFSTCNLLGLIWLVTIYYCTMLGNPLYDVLSGLVFGTVFVLLLGKYLEWNAMWSMSVVISILEEFYGLEAIALSVYFSKGNESRGFVLMLVFFVLGQCLRLSWFLFYDSYGIEQSELSIVPQICLVFFCLGNVLKWVSCVVYYFDCKNRILVKKKEETSSTAFKGKSLKGNLSTLIYVVFNSSCSLIGLIWLIVIYLLLLKKYEPKILYLLHVLVVLKSYLKLTSRWNMSLVISILEGIYGFRTCFSVDFLHLVSKFEVDFILFWNITWIVLQISLFFFGNVLKWIATLQAPSIFMTVKPKFQRRKKIL
ncbi:hypothetical protein G4B88_010976, partial [Cannabis sativa]